MRTTKTAVPKVPPTCTDKMTSRLGRRALVHYAAANVSVLPSYGNHLGTISQRPAAYCEGSTPLCPTSVSKVCETTAETIVTTTRTKPHSLL